MPKDVTYVAFHPKAKMRAALLLASVLTCGLAAPIWIGWEIKTWNKVYS